MAATAPLLDRQVPAALPPATTASCASPGSFHVYSINPAEERADFLEQLLGVLRDPQIKRLALRYAGDPDLAEDALQSAYCAVARMKHPETIAYLRAYFISVLKNEACRLYAPRWVTPVEDPEDVPGQHDTAVCGSSQARPFDEIVCFSLQVRIWLERLADERDCLLTAVSARSDDPARYRTVIYAAAEQVLRDAISAEPSEADTNDAFRAAWPQYFDPPGAAANACHQRFCRARTDVRALLQAVVRRDELT